MIRYYIIQAILVIVIWSWMWFGVHRFTERVNISPPPPKLKSFINNILDGPLVWLGVIFLWFNREKKE